MRKYVIFILLLFVAGVFVSFFLIPDEEQIALMHQHDQELRTMGYIDYQKEYDAGRRSEEVVVGLTNLYIGEGRGMEAMPVLEQHLQEYPDHTEARKKLAELYQAAGRDEDYLREIEMVAEQQPTEENLKLLADMYNYVGMYDKQAATLAHLIKVSEGTAPEYYVDLATIQTLQENKQAAAETLKELRRRHPEHISYKLVRLMVSSLVDTGETEQGYQEAKRWIDYSSQPAKKDMPPTAPAASGPSPKELADLTNIINYGGRPDLALALVDEHRDLVTRDIELFSAFINASVNAGKRDQAYAVLKRVYEEGKLPPSLYRPFIELALENDESHLAEAVVGALDNRYFNEDEAINLIELARVSENKELLNKLVVAFDKADYTSNKPALVAIIALIRRDTDEDVKVASAIQADLTRNSRLRLAQACARHRKTKCFNSLVAQFPSYAEMTPRELDEVVMLYISVDRQKEIFDTVRKVSETTDSRIVHLAYIKIAASLGERDISKPWIDTNGPSAETSKLADLYYLAADRRHYRIASDIAEILYDREQTQRHREMLVGGYMGSGQYAKALPFLRELRSTSRANEDNYLAALTKLGRSNSDYRKELADYVTAQMNSDSVSSKRKIQLVYMLINSGNKKKAVAYIDQYAKAEGGAWKKLHRQVHAKYIPPSGPAKPALIDMPRDYRMEVATDPDTSDDVRRMLAFSLLEDGYRDDAIYLFQMMTQDRGPESQEVRDLLYMWGPRLNEEQISWLAARANQSQGADLVKWGEYISYYGDDYALMGYVASNPDALAHRSIRQKYFKALAVNGSVDAFDNGMRDWMHAETDPLALRDYADIAKVYGYRDAAVRALKKANSIAPGDETILKDLGVLTYSQSDYSGADYYINQYMQVRSAAPAPRTHPFEAYFFQGELLRREKRKDEASQYYAQVLRDGPTQATTVERQSMYYSSQFHLGYHKEGKEGFYGLLAQYPQDRSLLADFMSILLEYKYYDEATAVANQYDSNSPYYQRSASAPLSLNSPYIQGIQSFEQGRELKISFNQPLKGSNIPELDLANHTWVEETEVGYDSMLIAAKPGYFLRFTPTSNQEVEIIPATYTLTAEEEMRRQQELRLQLLYARLELETGQEQQALARLNTLRNHYPRDAQLLGYTANAENYTGNWAQALNLLEQAQGLTPENEDIALLKKDIEKLHADNIRVDHSWRRIGDSDQYISTAEGQVRVTNKVEIGGSFQHSRLHASKVRPAATGIIGDSKHDKQRGEIWAAYHFDHGGRLQASGFANNDSAGGGLYYAINNKLGRTELLGEFHRPYWDFTEAVAEDATRDRVGIKHRTNLSNTTSMSAEASINRYHIKDIDDVASTTLLRANLVHQLRSEQPYVGVGYGFDGEYVLDKEYRTNANGEKYSPFPMTAREIHFVSGIVAHDITDSTHAQIVAGYAYDRLGQHGPQVEGRLTQDLGENLEAQVRARYGLQTNDTDQNVSEVGGHLKVKF